MENIYMPEVKRYGLQLPTYPKIFHLGHRAIASLFESPCYVQEKVDGSQFTFGLTMEGELQFRSKRVQIHGSDVEGNFAAAVANITEMKDLLTPGYIYRGEVLRGPKHNTITYNRAPKHNVIIFDIQPIAGDWLMPEQVKEECDNIGFEMVPTFRTDVTSFEQVEDLMKMESVLGGAIVEGIVFKNYDAMNMLGDPCFGKRVREDFQEKNNGNHKAMNPNKKDVLQEVIATYKNKNRWKKSVQHLTDEGKLQHAPQDIPVVMAEIQRDLEEECIDEIKDLLFKKFWPKIKRGCVGGVAEWYKEELTKLQFEEE